MKKKMETTRMGSIGTTARIDSFIPRKPKVSCGTLKLTPQGGPGFRA